MVSVDVKDRKILYELDQNCRQSNTQIGKKVGLKKDVVAYRIKRMEDEGILTGYWTAINTFKLGYYVFRIYITFVDVATDTKEEIISYFEKQKNLWALISSKGPADMNVILWINDIYQFNKYWNSTLEKYGNYFGKYTVSILTSVMSLKKTYLSPDASIDKNRILYNTNCSGQAVEIDELDWKILNNLALNARIPLINLAEKLGCSSQTASYRLKQLQDKDVIQAFRIGVDGAKIQLQSYAIDIYLKDHSQRQKMLEYIIQLPYTFDIMIMNVGWADITFQVMIENVEKLMEIMETLDSKFPHAIRRQEFWITKQVHKERWLPELS